MILNRSIAFALIVITSLVSNAQEKRDLTVSLGAGKLSSPYYSRNYAENFFSIDFDYQLSKRQSLSANFNSGSHEYYENILSNTIGSIKNNGTNSEASYQTFSILYKYQFIKTQNFLGTIGSGAGIMTQVLRYPYAEGTGSNYRQASFTDLVFPVRLEMDYKLSSLFKAGLIGGFYIHPDFPILAYYAGPRVSYTIK